MLCQMVSETTRTCPSGYCVTMWLVETVNPDVFAPALGTRCQ